jgi:endonuclease/exonuclease/phosphatase family metal-dependent hydrolase
MPESEGFARRAILGPLLLVILLVSFCPPWAASSWAHPGGVDENGGHRSASDGRYHFEKGPLAGHDYASREDAIAALRAIGTRLSSTIRLASFNIRILSDKSRTDQELGKIVAILRKYDVVAVQEVRDVKVLERIVGMLSKATEVEWRFEASPPVGRGVQELYAFLYRIDRVLLKEGGRIVADPKDRFIREPFHATFRAGNFDFKLLTIHALYKSKNAPERKQELDALSEVFLALLKDDPKEKDLLLLGDFNDDPSRSSFASLIDIPDMQCLFALPTKTTIGDVSLYDNICFKKSSILNFTGRSGVDRFDKEMFGGDLPSAELAVSDHRPVWADFSTDTGGN